MVDEAIVRRRLEALLRYRDLLLGFQAVDRDHFVSEPAQHDLAERYLHLASQAAIDLANHVIADRGFEAPETYRSAFDILARHSLITPELAARMQAWAGLRNILVHLYLDIDHGLTHAAIQRDLGDLDAFAAAMATLLS